ncbi:hypothetical protein [Bradyrhizobium sp.]|uniref:hypothetical protein n=1 Tax=Bradyrhizobium sp. TaxID=376 RepID=UPI001DC18122|nr:hypothetical protein [Bradyrhizobium sp.]MBI5322232.1 hypothetical protein [Bradyrhizobium sp.]
MDRHVGEWKHAVDRFWQAEGPDWTEVAHVMASIAATAGEADLRHAATQAQPSIRNAAANPQDHMTRVVARRRLGVVRDVLHELVTPKFGRRGTERVPTEDERFRQMLGLPLDRQLAATEIHQAFRRSAKRMHPDAGGDAHAFLALSAARDALMHPGSKKGG